MKVALEVSIAAILSFVLVLCQASPVPVVLWHGLGDSFDGEGLNALKDDLETSTGAFVHVIRMQDDPDGDRKATFFGNANTQVDLAWEQLLDVPEITDVHLNPSLQVDAIGFSQGGQLLRALVERYNNGPVSFRRLVTLGAQHMGISALPSCPPGSSPFSACRLMHSSLVRAGTYSAWAQEHIVPAQYFRDPQRLELYYKVNHFLKDINNEVGYEEEHRPRTGDEFALRRRRVDGPTTGEASLQLKDLESTPNDTYKINFSSLDRFVMFRFTEEKTVVPPQTSHFTVPKDEEEKCDPTDVSCYEDPLPWNELPLYVDDYIGLKVLNETGRVFLGVCSGEHMQIDEECWGSVKEHLTSKNTWKSDFIVQE